MLQSANSNYVFNSNRKLNENKVKKLLFINNATLSKCLMNLKLCCKSMFSCKYFKEYSNERTKKLWFDCKKC